VSKEGGGSSLELTIKVLMKGFVSNANLSTYKVKEARKDMERLNIK